MKRLGVYSVRVWGKIMLLAFVIWQTIGVTWPEPHQSVVRGLATQNQNKPVEGPVRRPDLAQLTFSVTLMWPWLRDLTFLVTQIWPSKGNLSIRVTPRTQNATKSHKINETIIGQEKVKKNTENLQNSTLIQETKNWLTLDGLTSLHLQPVFISITNAILILAVGVSIIYISTLHDTKSSSK